MCFVCERELIGFPAQLARIVDLLTARPVAVDACGQDALKLITLGRSRPNAQLIIAFADSGAAAYATKGTWISEALATWGVKVYVVGLEPAVHDGIRAAQARQVMANPTAPAPHDA